MTYFSRFTLLASFCLPILSTACAESDPDDIDLADEGADTDVGEEGSGDTGGDGETGSGDTGGETGAGDDGDTGGSGDTGDPDPEPGQLSAGEWRDLDHWDFWLGLGANDSPWLYEFDLWGFDTRDRVPVLVLSNDEPVVDAPVVLRDGDDQILWTGRTDNLGRAELWPSLLGGEPVLPLTVEAGGEVVELGELPTGFDPVLFDLPAPTPVSDLDLMFVVDTTGSMSDELSYLTVELGDVIQRVETEVAGDFNLRLSVNFYRDVGDEYVVRSFPFTSDINEALTQLSQQSADGGGDYPEAVEEGLADGIFGHQWSSQARARLLFLILDAPPHDTPQIRASLSESVAAAAEQGIRVIPVGASGINKETEFLLRNIDIATGGTYTFLTNHSGIGGEHLEPTVGEYQVEYFNDLLVRLVVEAME